MSGWLRSAVLRNPQVLPIGRPSEGSLKRLRKYSQSYSPGKHEPRRRQTYVVSRALPPSIPVLVKPASNFSGTRHFASSFQQTSRDGPGIFCEVKEHSKGHHVATLTVSNPAKMNIVSSPLLEQLLQACHGLVKDENLRVVVLTGGPTAPGKAASFIGGADIKEMSQLSSSREARNFILTIHSVCNALRDLPVPVLARVDGYCLGAGLEIMAACDLRVATQRSVFGMPEVKVGIPSVVEAALLPGLIGMGRTRRLLYLAENIEAGEAERWGLVEKVVDGHAELDEAVDEWVDRLVGMGPKAIRSQKALMRKWENCGVDEGVLAGVDAYAEAYADGGKEPHQFMGKFVNRRR